MGPQRFHLTLSTYGGLVPGAYHTFARVRYSDDGARVEVDLGRNYGRFEREAGALQAARRWFAREAPEGSLLTIGEPAVVDPQRVLCGPTELKARANRLWRSFERLDGWGAPRAVWPAVQAVTDAWSAVLAEHWRGLALRRGGRGRKAGSNVSSSAVRR